MKKTVAISAAISLAYRSKAKEILLALLAAACVCTAGAKCTFDFSAASERLYGGKVAGDDLLAGQKWSHHAWIGNYGDRPCKVRVFCGVGFWGQTLRDSAHDASLR